MAFNIRKFLEGIKIVPKASSSIDETGELEVISGSGKLNYRNNVDPTPVSPVVTEAHAAVLTNKTIDGDNNTIQDVGISSLKPVLGDADKVIRRDGSGIVISGNSLPNSSQIVTLDSSDTLTNKTLTSPVLNTPTADAITGIAGGALTVQSASNQNLSLQAQGTGVVSLESLTIDSNTVTGGASQLTIQSASNQNLSIQAQGTGIVSLESLTIDANTITGGAAQLTIQSASNQNLSLQAQGTGTVQLESLTVDGSTITSSGSIALSSPVGLTASTNTQTGSNVTLTAPTTSFVKLTAAGTLVSVDGITAGSNGQSLILTNLTGATVLINNNTGTAANRVITGTGGAIALLNNATLLLAYDTTSARWYVVGGVGGAVTFNATAGETLAVGAPVYISTGTGSDSGRTAGRVYLLDATNDDRIEFLGIALDASTAGNQVRVQVSGEVTGLSALSVGKPVFASVTSPGGLQTSAPVAVNQWVVPVGIATSATSLVVNGAGSSTAVKVTSTIVDGLYADVQSYSSSTVLTNANSVVLVSASGGAVTITLPAPARGKVFNIKKTDSSLNAVTISPPSGTIDGAASKSLAFQYDSLMITSDGTNFFLI